MPHDEFVNQVRDALTHLYDPVHLQSHPLADYLKDVEGMGQVTRAQKLRRLLLDALEQLSPPANSAVSPDASSHYSALHYRYIDGLSTEQIADILAVSPRQAYRKIREGIEAVASLLWDRLEVETQADHDPVVSAATYTSDRRRLAQATVQHLSNHAQPEMLEMGLLLGNIVKDLRSYCQQLGAEIVLHLPQKPLYVRADRTMLRQALINLLTHGLDRGHGRVMVMALTHQAGKLRLTLDTQPGNGQEIRLARAVEREGIGVEVANQLFHMQGIQVFYGTDRGSLGQAVIAEKGTHRRWHATIELPQVGPHHILVIDDMPDIPSLFRRFAVGYAVEIISATNASRAFEVLQSLTPALILLDVMLPQRDGWEILQTLKTDPATASIPVIVCSVLNEPELATALGADDYLKKPVTQASLLQALSRWLHLDPEPGATPP